MKQIYLAGFDVFRPDAREHGEYLKQLCRKYGFEGMFPLDNEAPSGMHGGPLAQWICDTNLALLRSADLVMANLNTFRGNEPDSGTVFEVGYAVALGKPVWAYTSETRTLVGQVAIGQASDGSGPSRFVDHDGYTVEDFGMPLNLMIACTTQVITGDVEDCLRSLAAAHDG
ncbi:nucleoside 2-deoxyribosyltransferase [Pusillimonas sp. TS35]|nr:nucleoside 2-deoxyribosyltransferase [Pusillimonas sp. TS35]